MGAVAVVTIRPGVTFTPDAAAAFRRAEAQVRKEFRRGIDVNSTYRDWYTQLSMYNAWQAYINGRGPYPGHSKALHPDDPLAFHTKGTALDSDDWTNARIVAILAENGFIRNRLYVPNENHHFEYLRNQDKNYGKPAGTGASKDDEMPKHESRENASRQALKSGWNVRAVTPKQTYLADYTGGGGEIGTAYIFVEAENIKVGEELQAQLVFEEMKNGKVVATRIQPLVGIPGTTGKTFGEYVMPYSFSNGRMFMRFNATGDAEGKAAILRTTVKKNYWSK